MVALPENGYPKYPNVAADVELPNVPAPETLLPPYTGDNEAWKGGPRGLQAGRELPPVSPMSPSFYAMFGDPCSSGN